MGQLATSRTIDGSPRLRIVVGVGRGDTSEHAVREALALATHVDDAELHVVGALAAHEGADLEQLREVLLDEERWLVDFVRWVASLSDRRPAPLHLVFHARFGSVVDVLTQVAFDVGASLIVVGATPRSRVARLLAGGVAERLFADARYPIYVARPIDTEGLVRTPRPEARRPGEPLHDDREALLESSDRVDFALPPPHVSGLL